MINIFAMNKKLFSTFFAALFTMSVPSVAYAETYSGVCGATGSNLTWTLDTSTGVLSITGTGAMKDYGSNSEPWHNYRRYISSITIGPAVTTIGYEAFDGCFNLTSVTIPESVTAIGEYAFSGCYNLTSVTIPESVTAIGNGTFSGCSGLTEFKGKFASDNGHCLIINDTLKAFAYNCGLSEYNIPDGVKVIDERAFSGCGLTTVTIGRVLPLSAKLLFGVATA